MMEFSYTIKDPNGLHARPAGLLVQEAQKYAAGITLACGEKNADLKRLFAVMKMNVKCGATVTVQADGPDEAQAVQVLEDFFKANF